MLACVEASTGTALALAVGDEEEEFIDEEENEGEAAALALLAQKQAAAEEAARMRVGATGPVEETAADMPSESITELETPGGARACGTTLDNRARPLSNTVEMVLASTTMPSMAT